MSHRKYKIKSLQNILFDHNIELACPIILFDTDTNYYITSFGRIYSTKNDSIKYITPRIDEHGYMVVKVPYRYNGCYKCANIMVHRLVAMAFIPCDNDNYDEVNHIDGNKLNNNVLNLEWVDHSANMLHAYKTGLHRRGEDNVNAKYTNDQIHLVCQLLERNSQTKRDISKITGVNISVIDDILSHAKWKHIAVLYDIDNYNVKAPNKGSTRQFSDDMIKKVCEMIESGKYTSSEIADICDVSYYTVCDIRSHKTWKHISKNYKF